MSRGAGSRGFLAVAAPQGLWLAGFGAQEGRCSSGQKWLLPGPRRSRCLAGFRTQSCPLQRRSAGLPRRKRLPGWSAKEIISQATGWGHFPWTQLPTTNLSPLASLPPQELGELLPKLVLLPLGYFLNKQSSHSSPFLLPPIHPVRSLVYIQPQ